MTCAEIKAEINQLLRAGPQGWAALRPALSAPTKAVLAAARSQDDVIDRRCQFVERYGLKTLADDDDDIRDFFTQAVELLRTQQQARRDYREARQKVIKDTWPAAELIVAQGAPNAWQDRWRMAGGVVYQGRAIAMKDSPAWLQFSEFDQPHEPFEWGNCFAVQDVDYAVARAAGLIVPAVQAPRHIVQPVGQGCAWALLLGVAVVFTCGAIAAVVMAH